MIRIAIVEDERRERAHLRDCLAYMAEKEQLEFDIVEFGSGEEFLGGYQPVYDIVLMDIELPGINGMETAMALRRMDAFVLLVFVTNMVQYAVSGYEVNALNYILKPVNRFDFALKMNKAISRLVGTCDLFLLQPVIMPYVHTEVYSDEDAADVKRRGTLSFYVQVTPLADYHKSLIISNEDWQLGAFELRGKLSTEE